MEVMDLCKPCVCAIENEGKYHCREVKGGVNNKIRCERCQRMRYGKTYRLEERKEPHGNEEGFFSPELLAETLTAPTIYWPEDKEKAEIGGVIEFKKFHPLEVLGI